MNDQWSSTPQPRTGLRVDAAIVMLLPYAGYAGALCVSSRLPSRQCSRRPATTLKQRYGAKARASFHPEHDKKHLRVHASVPMIEHVETCLRRSGVNSGSVFLFRSENGVAQSVHNEGARTMPYQNARQSAPTNSNGLMARRGPPTVDVPRPRARCPTRGDRHTSVP
ncbi:hypothetical protein BD413DRAFT_146063 [Trametes elegans]|nr:hypothetical protein BD413DRAFT_146063 [Trametes elegans]